MCIMDPHALSAEDMLLLGDRWFSFRFGPFIFSGRADGYQLIGEMEGGFFIDHCVFKLFYLAGHNVMIMTSSIYHPTCNVRLLSV